MQTSLIVTTHNSSADLPPLARAIGRLDPPPDELIVVDDASTDGTVEAATRLLGGLIADLVVHPRRVNGGTAASRNDGLALASGRYVFLNDADDLPLPNRIRDQLLEARTSGAAIVVGRALEFDDHGLAFPRGNWRLRGDSISRNLLYSNPVYLSTVMVDRAQFSDEFSPSLRHHEDYDFLLNAIDRGVRISSSWPRPVCLYRRNSGGKTAESGSRSTSLAEIAGRHPGVMWASNFALREFPRSFNTALRNEDSLRSIVRLGLRNWKVLPSLRMQLLDRLVPDLRGRRSAARLLHDLRPETAGAGRVRSEYG